MLTIMEIHGPEATHIEFKFQYTDDFFHEETLQETLGLEIRILTILCNQQKFNAINDNLVQLTTF